jgi:DNA modification methylase
VEELTDWGFTNEELFGDDAFEEPEAEEDDYEIPDEIQTDIVIGDLIEIGEHRLLCGDSTDSDQVAKLMNGEKADMVFTDPPYGINEKGDRSKRGGLAKGNNLPDFIDDSIQYAIDAFNQPQNFDIPIQVWFGANYYCHSLPQGNNWLVWDKRVEEKQRDTQSDCELAWVKSRFNSVRIFRHLWKGMMKDSERGQRRVHATQKPIALIEFTLNEYGSKEGDLVIDYFTGSGSTMVACQQLGRKCYGMELDPKYCQVIIDRMMNSFPELEVRINGENYVR